MTWTVAGKRVLVRCDLNVPMKDGKVTDATRIERSAETLKALSDKGARVIVLSHFGRPKGKRAAEFSQQPLVEPLAKALGRKVAFAEDCVGPAAEQAVKALQDGDVLLLENLRFHDARGSERSGLRQAARGARRSLCQRCLLGGASRPCLDRGRSRISCPQRPGA